MNEYHCLEIEFLDVDFNLFGYRNAKTEINTVYHAHLYVKENEIELQIMFDIQTDFGEAFMDWSSNINPHKFGSFLKVELTENHTNERLHKIDLSEAKLLGAAFNTSFSSKATEYVSVSINTVKFFWNPNEEKKNTAEFYLDDKGFRVVESFYSILFPKKVGINDSIFDIRRMTNSTKFYKLGKSTFRPEFNFVSKDNRKDRVATITKEPKIQFKYKDRITEEEAIFYGDIVLKLASFYHHLEIDYVLRRIHLPESTITMYPPYELHISRFQVLFIVLG